MSLTINNGAFTKEIIIFLISKLMSLSRNSKGKTKFVNTCPIIETNPAPFIPK